eukprot:TCONS_00071384-protein
MTIFQTKKYENDAYSEDESERRYLMAKPTCFVIFGKPGSGKTTLAKYFAKFWKCVHVTVTTAIERSIQNKTPNGIKAEELLTKGEELTEEVILDVLSEMLVCEEVQHHGYVLEGFPLLIQDSISVQKQMKFLSSLQLSPDYIINLKLRDVDACNRLKGHKYDPITNKLYDKQFYDIDGDRIVPQLRGLMDYEDLMGDDEEGEGEGDGEDDDVDSLEDDIEDFNFDNGVVEDFEGDPDYKKHVVERLVTRTEEFPENVVASVGDFRKYILPKVEDYIDVQDQKKVLELDAALPAKTVFTNLRTRLDTNLLQPVVTPIRLQGSEEQEEITEDTDVEDMLRTLAASEMIAPGFRWRRSRWGQLCPVSLANGSVTIGKPEFSVSFMDKLFLMATEESMENFIENPRKYIRPPQPAPPCKLFVLGQSLSGKTTLCNKLANRYRAQVINVGELATPDSEDIRLKKIENKKERILESIIAKVKATKGDEEEVDENTLEVQELLASESEVLTEEEMKLTIDDYVDCVERVFLKMYEGTDKGPSAGGWIIDGFPRTKEEYNLMVDRGIVPDDVFVFNDDSSENECLVERWNKKHRNGSPMEDMNEEDTEKKKAFEASIQNFERDWVALASSFKKGSVDITMLSCQDEEAKAFNDTTKKMEASYQYRGWEYTGMDQDEEEEDFAAIDEDEDDEGDEDPNKQKPFGETAHYCPVMLKERNVLWPGAADTAVKYREKVYFLSSPEVQERFLEDPKSFLPDDRPVKPPPIRLILLGPKGSGKTLHGRLLAKKFGLMHISFKDRLQELLLPKLQKKIGPDFEFEEDQDEDDEEYKIMIEALEKQASEGLAAAEAMLKEDSEEELKKKKSNNENDDDDELVTVEESSSSKEDSTMEITMVVPDLKQEPPPSDSNSNSTTDVAEPSEETLQPEDSQAGIVELTEFEENIKNYVMEEEMLMQETLDEILPHWWNKEPFKSTGFILEGFPRNAEEAKYLAAEGFFPDGCIALTCEDKNIVDRLLPAALARWKARRERTLAKRERKYQAETKLREAERIRRKREKIKEREQRKKENYENFIAAGGEKEEYEEEDEDEDFDLDEIIEMEIIEDLGEIEDDDMDDESEEEAIERIKDELSEKFEGEVSQIEGVAEALEELLIPRLDVDSSRKIHITQYTIMQMLKPQVEFRDALFDRCQPINMSLAKKLLNAGYKKPSRFGRWDPVKLFDGDVLPPYFSRDNPCHPVVYRQYIYFLSHEENKERFIQSPQKFLQQASPKPLVPIKVAIIGPPKSGKTTLAKRLEKECGIVRLSIGEALRNVMSTHAHTKLVKQIEEYLLNGFPLPDELAIEALQLYLMDPVCHTRGFVLDGFPVTSKQMELLHTRSIIPYKVIYLDTTDEEIMRRGAVDRKSPSKTLTLHDSHTILAIKVACYRREEKAILEFYRESYKNLVSLDAEKSKWWLFNRVTKEMQEAVANIQTYIQRVSGGRAACIHYMCITPSKLQKLLGEFGEYCPVSLAEDLELHDCSSQPTHELVAEYRGKYYRFPDSDKMKRFLKCPSKYVMPLAPHPLPVEEDLPKKKTAAYLKKIFPQEIELKGYCPVTYFEGNFRYECILPGEQAYLVEYKKRAYCFLNEQCQTKFLRSPERYYNLTLPKKLPPKKDLMPVSQLPMLGYLEQTVASAVIKSVTSVGCAKPKFPFLSAKRSALLYLAFHLKANNPKASEYVRKKYKRKLAEFENNCELIAYLSKFMKARYLEPEDRPIDFDHKLQSFTSMRFSGVV